MAVYLQQARPAIAAALVASGLFEDEAWAMVDTWTGSWLQTPGTRLLYLLPRQWTDELLPLSLSVTPTEIERTLVGRIDFLTPEAESKLAALLDQALVTPTAEYTWSFDKIINALAPLAEAKLFRLCELVKNPEAQFYCPEVQKAAHGSWW
jgi:hypothetical protein